MDTEIAARIGSDWVTIGRAASLSKALQRASKNADVPHSLAHLAVYEKPRTLIRVYYRPTHEWGETISSADLQRRSNPSNSTRSRKRNPTMPTAAQLRARAAFSKIMKSGGFPAAKKKRRKNPVGHSGRSTGPISFTGGGGNANMRRDLNPARRKKNPAKFFDSGYAGVGHSGRSGPDMGQRQASNDPRGYRDLNPSPRGARRYHVIPANGKGPVGLCKTMPEAKKLAHLFADTYKHAFGIITE